MTKRQDLADDDEELEGPSPAELSGNDAADDRSYGRHYIGARDGGKEGSYCSAQPNLLPLFKAVCIGGNERG